MVDVSGELRLLFLIGEHGSLTGAAAELGLTTAAVTGQVARVERRRGVPLVHRGPRGARLTPAGVTLAEHGRTVDEACRHATAELDETLGRISQRLRIGSFASVTLRVLPEAMTALRHRRPASDLSIVEGTSTGLVRRVAGGEVDLAVVATYGDRLTLPPWLTAVSLLQDPLVVCLPVEHRLARTAPSYRVRLAQLRGEPWVAILSGETARDQFDRAARAHRLAPRVLFETESHATAQAMVGTGLGVAVLARLAAQPTAGAVHRELERPRLHRQLWAVHARDTRLAPLVPELLGLIHEVCAELAADWAAHPVAATSI